MLARESDEFRRVRRGAREVAPDQFEHGHVPFPEYTRADKGEVRDPRLSVANDGNRAPDVAQWPQREREIKHHRDARVLSEAERQIVIAPGHEQGQRAFQVVARSDVVSSVPMRDSRYGGVNDSGLRRTRTCLESADGGPYVSPHRRQLAAHVAADPQAVVGRQPFGRVLVAAGPLARSCESFSCFNRAVTPRCDQRVAVGDVQFLPLA